MENTLQSGIEVLAKALQSFPGLSEISQFLSSITGKQSAPQAAYNGTIDALGQQVEIVDGIGKIEGRPIYVSPGGEFVADSTGQIIGRVVNGKFSIIDKDHGEFLMKNKLAERK